MADLSTFLSAKRLGAPTWVWATGGVAVIVFVYLKYRASKTAATTAASTTNTSAAAGSTEAINPSGYPVSQDFTDTTYNTNPPPVITPPPVSTSTGSGIPGPLNLIQTANYVVKGQDTAYTGGSPGSGGFVSDVWPDGIAQNVYGLDPNDKANHAGDAILITLDNPTLIPPYPVGTKVLYPVNGPQGWVPAPQTTSTTTNNTVSSASGG